MHSSSNLFPVKFRLLAFLRTDFNWLKWGFIHRILWEKRDVIDGNLWEIRGECRARSDCTYVQADIVYGREGLDKACKTMNGSLQPCSCIFIHTDLSTIQVLPMAWPGNSVSDSWPGGCGFDIRLRPNFLSWIFRTVLVHVMHISKVVKWLWKGKSHTGVKKPGSN